MRGTSSDYGVWCEFRPCGLRGDQVQPHHTDSASVCAVACPIVDRSRAQGHVLVVVFGPIHAQTIQPARYAVAPLVEPHSGECDADSVNAVVNPVLRHDAALKPARLEERFAALPRL